MSSAALQRAQYCVPGTAVPRYRPARWMAPEALSLKALAKLTQRLQGLAIMELQPRPPGTPKPHRLHIAFDEMTITWLCYARLLPTVEENSHK